MAYDYSELVEQTKTWIEQAVSAGWLNSETARAFCDFDVRTPESLFNHSGSRPLIVAFMGGTGVGKSSLLNRLAGKAIAKSGVERPTSREVTLFHHQDIAIKNLPNRLPIEKIKIAQHDDATKKNIVWIDMPDFDSTELSNKAMVFEWLPHIDILIYVVSPERYRDEKAWRLLLSEGNRHAWLFVLNQWDTGQQAQYEDFKRQLGKAGFLEPIIFKTVCGENFYPDEFADLQATLLALSNKHIVAELEQRGMQVRKTELKQKLRVLQQQLGQTAVLKQAEGHWQTVWQSTVKQLEQGLTWPMQRLAAYYADHSANLINNPMTGTSQPERNTIKLWDAWAHARLGDALDELIANIDEQGLPVVPIKDQLVTLKTKAPKVIEAQAELQVRQALANPGSAMQRGLLKLIRLCEILLPLAAIAWVADQVMVGYYDSNMTHDHYLGIDFAIHSSLLILISWIIPWFILKKIKPSLESSALKGLKKGLTIALATLESDVVDILKAIAHQHVEQIKSIEWLADQCSVDSSAQPVTANADSPLPRMLI